MLNNGTGAVGVNGLYYSFTQDYRADGTVQVNTDDIRYAGTYSGAMLFTIGYVAPPAVITDFSGLLGKFKGIYVPKTAPERLSVEFNFNARHTFGQCSNIEVSLFKEGKKIAVNKMKIAEAVAHYGDGYAVTCPFYFDMTYDDPYWDSEFLTSSFTGTSADTILLKVVKGGKTYFFQTTNIGPYVAG